MLRRMVVVQSQKWAYSALLAALFFVQTAFAADSSAPEGESFFFTPPGSKQEGLPKTAEGPNVGQLKVIVRDDSDGEKCPCRIYVLGADGHFYQPPENPLSAYTLGGEWPKGKAKGNRRDKAPYRFLGRYFYSTGETIVSVPAGVVQVHIEKGFEFQPQTITRTAVAGMTQQIEVRLKRTSPMENDHYYGGDLHLHLLRASASDEETVFDLLDAEDIWYGTPLGYNEPAGPYFGFMEKMDYPQLLGLGANSIKSRGNISILSGQEYRSAQYGHLNLFYRDRLVMEGQNLNADDWPVYGLVGQETRSQGGYSFHAHGGYGLEIYADAALGTVNGVELLQFGIYRGIGLNDWYHMLNSGYRFPCVGASDYPACRFLGDCRTYIWNDSGNSNGSPRQRPTFQEWLQAAADGKSFVTTGPLLQLEVDGKRPGEIILVEGKQPKSVTARIRLRSEVTPVTHVQLIVNGRGEKVIEIPAAQQKANWFSVEEKLDLTDSSWIAARAWSTTAGGQPDAESHTNPVYVYLNGKKPYQQKSLDAWVLKIDGQMAKHRERTFAHKSQVLDYFQRSRDLLLKIREQKGLGIGDDPARMGEELERADAPSFGADVSRADASDAELKDFLKPVPPKPPLEAVNAFEGVDGFHMELVAAEPLVNSPIAAAFDEDANLYICEMRDYPYKPVDGLEPIGRVRLLRDTNGDGVYDEAHVFADKLLWTAGVVPWKGGVFVASCPDIWYFKDTDGDFKADIKRKVFTGFGTGNQQAMVNNLQLGMDHWIYGSTAGNGGSIRKGDQPDATPISVSGRDFRFDPVTEQFETVTGTVQFGNTFDDWGNRFVCSESSPIEQIVLPEHYLARNPFLPSPRGVLKIAQTPVPIYRISPIERWRQIRSSRRIANNRRSANSAGASHHVIDAAAGVTIYRGGAYPPEFYGQAFVGDGQNNLIHRRLLKADGVPFKTERIDQDTDFIRTPDIWFRPVNLINAPDGTLYCCDMSREVLESIHIPLDVVKHLDLKSGRDSGRIYRIAPPGYTFPKPPHLSDSTTEQLVANLESPHVWWRETSLRLLHERQDHSVNQKLRSKAIHSQLPQARLLAMRVLQGFDALNASIILAALDDPHPGVRENVIRMAEPFLKSEKELIGKISSLADDPNTRIRFQVALTLGEAEKDDRSVAALARIARHDGDDQWIRTAILSSVSQSAERLFVDLLKTPSEPDAGVLAILGQLAQVVGVRNQPDEINQILESIEQSPLGKNSAQVDRLLLELGTGLVRSGGKLQSDPPERKGSKLLQDSLSRAEKAAINSTSPPESRVAAIRLISCSPSQSTRLLLAGLLSVEQPEPVQLAAIRGLADDGDSAVSEILLGSLKTLTPEPRRAAYGALLSREDGTLTLLKAADNNDASVSDVESTRRELLLKHKNDEIRRLAAKLFGAVGNRTRKAIVDDYQSALKLTGDPTAGKQLFEKTCIACHRLGDKGYSIGPNLVSSPAKEPAALLTHILDPNQYVLPNYMQYVVVDKTGRVYTGLLSAQTPTSITLKKEREELITILRGDIDEFSSSNKSLMPEGLEKEIPIQAMADLIAYLNQASLQASEDPNAARDFGTLPGLIETSRD